MRKKDRLAMYSLSNFDRIGMYMFQYLKQKEKGVKPEEMKFKNEVK